MFWGRGQDSATLCVPLLAGDALQHVLDARHHALEPAEVDVRAVVQQVEHLVRVLLHLEDWLLSSLQHLDCPRDGPECVAGALHLEPCCFFV